MKELLEKIDEQNIMVSDYHTIIKLIEASLQRGAIRANEATTVGKLYDKCVFMINKHNNKEKQDGGLSKTNN
tara:strand:+ start:2165 stop:2380 length:216 start_codon:yes stop_codon:yes gene_type:complete